MSSDASKLRPIRGGRPAFVSPAEVSVALEQELLEGILADPSTRARVASVVEPIDFFLPKNRAVYAAMERVEAITLPLLADELGRCGELERVGGVAGLAELFDHAVTPANVEAHARLVRRHALERRARVLHERAAHGEDVRRELEQVDRSLDELEALRANLDSILISGVRLRDLRGLDQATLSPLPMLLDVEPSLHLIQGRPKSGKTTLALFLLLVWCQGLQPWRGTEKLPGTRALVVSAEQTARRIDRVLQRLSKSIAGSDVETWTDRLSIAARAKSTSATMRKLFTMDAAGRELLRSVLANARTAGDPFGLVVLDSLSRIKPGDADENSADDMTAVLAPLQEIAEAERVYLIVIHHRGHNGDPARSGAVGASRGSSAIAAVSSVAWTLDAIEGNPRLRVLRVAGNEVLAREQCFEVADNDAKPGEIHYWQPIDRVAEEAERIDELIKAQERINLTELAWRIAGKRPDDGNDRPPGTAMTLAGKLVDHWSEMRWVEVERLGKGRPTWITRVGGGSV